MHVLYVHQNFPAQFGHIAHHLVEKLKWRCSFVSETPAGKVGGIEKIQYRLQGGATKQNHFCSRTFENTVWHCDGVYRAMKARPDIRPDLIVCHSGFGSTLFSANSIRKCRSSISSSTTITRTTPIQTWTFARTWAGRCQR